MTNRISLTPENIQATLSLEDKIILLNFFSAQHPECVQQMQVLETLSAQYHDALVLAVLDCDLQAMLASQLAQQIGLQSLPTTVVLKNGSPLDVISGLKTVDELTRVLAEHLPAPEEMYLVEAQKALAAGDTNKAYELAKQALDAAPQNSKAKLIFADLCIQLNKTKEAKLILDSVAIADQDAYFLNLLNKLIQAEERKVNPRIIALKERVEAEPLNLSLRAELADLLIEQGLTEEALDALLTILKKDMSFGEAKKTFLELIASLPNGDKVAVEYRRRLYSLLY
ncbi:tetratricopeptide repeat protein [Pseudoalteromonas xiamenensis]